MGQDPSRVVQCTSFQRDWSIWYCEQTNHVFCSTDTVFLRRATVQGALTLALPHFRGPALPPSDEYRLWCLESICIATCWAGAQQHPPP